MSSEGFSPADEHYMQHALRLAAAATSLASPNPRVGCLLVRDGKVLGSGTHLYDLFDHAEIAALKQAASRGLSAQGATAYVTLEPCSHHGRTGPCADALVAAGISRCVVATTDPNPLVSGRGIEKLRAAGIEVAVGLLQQQARDLNDAFAHFIRTRTPFVTLKSAISSDGKLAPPTSDRCANQPHWLTSPESRYQVQLLRHASDAILTGIGTVLADDPQLTDRSELPRRRPLLRVVLDTHLRIPLTSQLVQSANKNLLILTSDTASEKKIALLTQCGAEVLPLIEEHEGHLSLPAVLTALAEHHILSVLLEAGSHLNAAFLRQNLVGKAVLFHAPSTLGDEAIPFAEDISPFDLEQSLQRVTRDSIGPDLRVTGSLHDPWG
ncbi:MAG TPA: bifunctional diaminohydroxyphosphoribosylaminopyrimidine deaminase/5-amino-6-(5-phosphoribosylamino)uracil reductase RibD [Edaphobacter sp.]